MYTYCCFSVSRHSKQIKIKIKTLQQIKSGIWEMKGGKYTKTLAKIQARRIFRIRDIRRKVLPKFIEICMETPCHAGAHLDGHQHGGRKPTKKFVTEFQYKRVNLFLEELITIKVILFPIHELLRQQNSPKYVTDSSLGRQVNATSRSTLEIQPYSTTKPRTLLKRKFV